MKVVARQAASGAQVVPIHAGVRLPAADPGLAAKVAELQGQLQQLVKVHNATVDTLNKTQKQLTVLTADHMTLKRGCSSLAKHFQGFVAASQIQYTPAVVQRAQPAAAPAPQAARTVSQPRAAPPSQQVVNAQPAQPAAEAQSVWDQREALFYDGGESPEG